MNIRQEYREELRKIYEGRRRIIARHGGIIPTSIDDLVNGKPLNIALIAQETRLTDGNPDKAHLKILKACESGEFDIIVAPEYSFYPSNGPMSAGQMNWYVENLRNLSHGKLIFPGTFVWNDSKTVENTAFALYDGNIVQYSRNRSSNEPHIHVGENKVYQTGKDTCEFQWRGLDVGVEICSDSGILQDSQEKDLIVLVSNGMTDYSRSYESIREGGYLFVSDGLNIDFSITKKLCEDYVETVEQRAIREAYGLFGGSFISDVLMQR